MRCSRSDPEQIRDDDGLLDLDRESLDSPDPLGIDWGGDGSDLTRPVLAHVLVALRPRSGPYQPPIDGLLALGDVDGETLQRRAEELGIGQEQVPELIRMLRDRDLNTTLSEQPAAWAKPVTATPEGM